jgi:hypothetical protein
MTYSDFLPVFIKQYKEIQHLKIIFSKDIEDSKEVEIKMSEGFAIRELAFTLFPQHQNDIRNICTQIRCDLKKEREALDILMGK